MAQFPIVASTVLMGLVLAGVFVAGMRRYHRTGYRYEEEASGTGAVRSFLAEPVAWTLGFILLVLVFGGGTVLYVGGFLDPATVAIVGLGLAAAGVIVFAGYLVYGMYRAARGRGHTSAGAAGEAVITLGLVVLLVIVGRLVVSSP